MPALSPDCSFCKVAIGTGVLKVADAGSALPHSAAVLAENIEVAAGKFPPPFNPATSHAHRE